MLSLLFDVPLREKDFPPPIAHTCDIMLDNVLAAVAPDIRLQNAALKVLCRPLVSEREITYRREIIEDFLLHRLPLSKTKELFGKFCDYESEYLSRKKQMYRMSGGQDGTAKMLDAVRLVQFAADTLKKLLCLIKDIHSLMCAAETSSQGIEKIARRISAIAESPDTEVLLKYAETFEHYTLEDTVQSVKFVIDVSGKMSRLGLCKVSAATSEKPESELLFGIFKKKKTEMTEVKAQFNPNDKALIMTNVISDIAAAFEFVINSVSDEFGGISSDLMFYDFAVKYCEALDKIGAACCFAEFSESTKISGLYDLYLLLTRHDPSTVVPNGFALNKDSKGIIIEGDNSSGKTVYLRSIASAYIFTQSGLPIPAESAQVALQNGIFLQTASAKNTLEGSDGIGRFEEEVIELKETVNSAADGSLALFNEIFQTTDHSEGAEGLYHILEYLNRKGARWILVTHLKRLAKMYSGREGVTVLQMGGTAKYKVCAAGDSEEHKG